MSCQSDLELTSGHINIFYSATNELCGIYIMKADRSLIPFARSYDGFEWESAPGPCAIPMEDISCSGGSCLIELPALQNVGESYIMLKKNTSIDDRGQIARFLEQVSQPDTPHLLY